LAYVTGVTCEKPKLPFYVMSEIGVTVAIPVEYKYCDKTIFKRVRRNTQVVLLISDLLNSLIGWTELVNRISFFGSMFLLRGGYFSVFYGTVSVNTVLANLRTIHVQET
jgi:hypothetical protein